jgi:hypothetical protein
MVRPGRERLQGTVEVDETYVGGIEQGTRGRGTERKLIVAIAIEVLSPIGFGRRCPSVRFWFVVDHRRGRVLEGKKPRKVRAVNETF